MSVAICLPLQCGALTWQVFSMVDTVGAGLLDGEALYKALRALGLEVPVSPAGIEDLLRTVGRENDGYIDYDDFQKIVEDMTMVICTNWLGLYMLS